jgi:hypothetical protein
MSIATRVARFFFQRSSKEASELDEVSPHQANTSAELELLSRQEAVESAEASPQPRDGAQLSDEESATHAWKRIALPEDVLRIPSMLTHEELQYLSWLTAEVYEGWGAIIDLGPWLGSSSAALADGLRRAGRVGTVRAFDLFQWSRSYMESQAPENLPEGEDFQFLFRRHIAPFAAWMDAEKQDLMHYRWEGGPIEILFVDAAKSWELTNQILRGFGQALVPNKSRVILQDYRFWYTYWLPLIFDSRPDVWEEAERIEYGTTGSFRPLKSLFGPCGITLPYTDEGFLIDSASAVFRSRIQRESSINRAWFALSFYRKALISGAKAEADAVRKEFQEEIAAAGLAAELANAEGGLPDVVPGQS